MTTEEFNRQLDQDLLVEIGAKMVFPKLSLHLPTTELVTTTTAEIRTMKKKAPGATRRTRAKDGNTVIVVSSVCNRRLN